MRILAFILAFFVCVTSNGQSKKIIGSWVSSSQDLIIIKDFSTGYLGNSFFNLSVLGDTLSFWERGVTGRSGKYEAYEFKYNFKVIQVSDSFMLLTPCSDHAKELYNGREKIKFIKQEFAVDPSIHFEKIIFQSTGCYGECPSFHLQVDSAMNAMLHVKKIYTPRLGYRSIEESSGYFKGKLSNLVFKKMTAAIQSFSLQTVAINPELCCDGSVLTFIIYYNGQRKYIKTMFPPRIMSYLIDTLYLICETSHLTKIVESFTLEE